MDNKFKDLGNVFKLPDVKVWKDYVLEVIYNRFGDKYPEAFIRPLTCKVDDIDYGDDRGLEQFMAYLQHAVFDNLDSIRYYGTCSPEELLLDFTLATGKSVALKFEVNKLDLDNNTYNIIKDLRNNKVILKYETSKRYRKI